MKRCILLLAVFTAPQLVWAQTTSAPAPTFIAKTPLPNAQELLNNIFAPYEAAKTFRGTFDVLIKNNNSANTVSEIHLNTRFRFDDKGDLARQDTTLQYVGRVDHNQRPKLHFSNDGHAPRSAVLDQKVWWSADRADATPAVIEVLKPILGDLIQALNHDPNFVPRVSRGVEAGRPVFILSVKGSNVFRAVVDAQTRALRSFEVLNNVSIRGSNQSFDEPIGDAEFAWTPPADFKQVVASDVVLPLGMVAYVQQAEKDTPPTR